MPTGTTIAVACDHAGLLLKREIVAHLSARGVAFEDLGTNTPESVDYPDFAAAVARGVAEGTYRFGILVCGTGIGMSIAANKFAGIRAATCTGEFEARVARAHNDANILCLGGRVTGPGVAVGCVDLFLATEFEGGRHARRVAKITALERG
jgi:ribose 5-phosphate isomerase B